MVQTSRWISLLWVVIQACQWLESLTDVILLTETEKELDGAEARTRGSALQTLQSLVSRNSGRRSIEYYSNHGSRDRM